MVVYAGAVNDYQKDLQFKKLNAQKDVIEVKVLRNGEDQLIGNEEIVVGDILLLDTGDKVCVAPQLADCATGNLPMVLQPPDALPCSQQSHHASAGHS
jgi:magnesium-transporting ATPase (P-type)